MVDAFEARQVGSTLHIMAKTHYSPWHPSLVPVIEGLAEAMAGTFNTQGMANTLWPYATMGQSPGAGVMLVLEGLGCLRRWRARSTRRAWQKRCGHM